MTTEARMNDQMAAVPNPDMNMEIFFTIHDDGTPFIIHDIRFTQPLSWIEYDHINQSIDYMTESGEIRNFRVPVHPQFGEVLKQIHSIAVVYMVGGKAIDGIELPLVIHN
jgi:hypothetical protein